MAHTDLENPYSNHLPIFPTLYGSVSEDRVERMVERLTNFADAALMAGRCTQAQYDAWTRALDTYARQLLWQQR